MKVEEKRKYESPLTVRTQVEMEEGICGASVVPTENQSVETAGHEKGDTWDAGTWDSNDWN